MKVPVVASTTSAPLPRRHQVIEITSQTGATNANLVAQFKIDSSAAEQTEGTITFLVDGVPDGLYGGGVWKYPGAGWERVDTASVANKGAFRSKDPTSRKYILFVDDTAADLCQVFGCKSINGMNRSELVDAFPQAGVVASVWQKRSTNSSGLPAQWQRGVYYADSRFLYIIQNLDQTDLETKNNAGRCYYFGDLKSTRPGGDDFATVLNSRPTLSNQDSTNSANYLEHQSYVARTFQGTGVGSLDNFSASVHPAGGTTSTGATNIWGDYPSPVDGGCVVGPWVVRVNGGAANNSIRGYLPAAYVIGQRCSTTSNSWPFVEGEYVDFDNGRTMRVHAVSTQTTVSGFVAIDSEGPWF